MRDIRFTLAARCEAAGRENNEDNYQVIADIAGNRHGFMADEELQLGELGTLLVVCDGMGGMNAGEVASAIAVKTIKDCFAAEKIAKAALSAPEKYIVSSIQSADAAIKAESKRNPATEGMGSTIVLAWLLRGKVYVGWCGDSRAYRYNAVSGIERLSHDHSYVQELVDAGSITEELAFFHPNNNIITRSLGDPRGAAQPDTKIFDIQQGDIYLLCSDGLCGCLQDHQIQEVIEQHHSTISECRDALWQADEAAGWHDNVTTVLAQITAGGVSPAKEGTDSRTVSNSTAKLIRTNRRLKSIIVIVVALLIIVIVGIFATHFIPQKGKAKSTSDSIESVLDTTAIDTVGKAHISKSIEIPKDETQIVSSATTASKTKADSIAQVRKDSLKAEQRRVKEQKQVAGGVKLASDSTEETALSEQDETVPEVKQTTIQLSETK